MGFQGYVTTITPVCTASQFGRDVDTTVKDQLCAAQCGRPVVEKSHTICRWCFHLEGCDPSTKAEILEMIHAQLGSNESERSVDPILSQLG